jgi:predicted PurR-regulated permease PerM
MAEPGRKRPVEAPAQTPSEQATVPGPTDIRNLSLSILAVLAVILMLQYMQPVLIPIALGILISYALWPIVTTLSRVKIPRPIGAAVAVVVFVGTLGFLFYTFSDEAMGIVRDIPPAARALGDRMEARRRENTSTTALEQVQEAASEIDRAAAKASEPAVQTKGIQKVEVVAPPVRVSDYVGMGGGIVGLAGQFVIILFLVYFLLVTGDLFKRKLVKIAGPTLTKKKVTVQIIDDINRQIESFMKVQIFTSLLVATATAAALWWFGVQHYIIWGLLSGLLNSIPYMGPLIVTGGLAVVAFMQFDDVAKTVYVAGTALVITSLEGFLLTPALLSRAAQMNPAAIFISLLFWSWVWGVWGTVLAVPMMMMIKSICDHVEDLQPIGELLGE